MRKVPVYEKSERNSFYMRDSFMEAEIVFGSQRTHLVDQVAHRQLGYCYNCNYHGHTVKHCPLSYCTSCKSWGHMFRVCPERKQQELIALYGDDGVRTFKRAAPSLRFLPPLPKEFQHGVSLSPELPRADGD